jgi:ABC-type multidrug transport system fused ATPase/permease subunit
MIWRDVEKTGCDPSDSVDGNETCPQSGPDVFGAMLGVAFAAQGLSQCGNFFATFTAARVACYAALQAINRSAGTPEKMIYEESTEEEDKTTSDVEEGEHVKELKAILPKYTIDSSSSKGLNPTTTQGAISFKGVDFHYPTRPNAPVLLDFNLEIEAGKTVALVGPRYVRSLV